MKTIVSKAINIRQYFSMKQIYFYTLILGTCLVMMGCGRGNSSNSVIAKDEKIIKKQIIEYLKKSIRHPKSYKSVDWEIIPKTDAETDIPDKYVIKHRYKAKDGIGTIRNEMDCFFFSKKEDVLLKDDSCKDYEEIYRRIIDEIKEAI